MNPPASQSQYRYPSLELGPRDYLRPGTIVRISRCVSDRRRCGIAYDQPLTVERREGVKWVVATATGEFHRFLRYELVTDKDRKRGYE